MNDSMINSMTTPPKVKRMRNNLDQHQDNSINRSLAQRNGIRPVARVTPTDSYESEQLGPGPFNFIQSVLGEQHFAMIAAYSVVILGALGYVPGLPGFGL